MTPNVDPSDFFLDGEESDGYYYDARPVRDGVNVLPLIDGVTAFSAMEAAVAGASASVLLSFWVFNPDTPVQNAKVRQAGASTWGDLIRRAADRGVAVRVLITDFDALLQPELHRYAWTCYRKLVGHAARLGSGKRANLQVVVSMHPASVRVGLEERLSRALGALVSRANRNGVGTTLADRPGVWHWLLYGERGKKVSVKPDATLRAAVATHHQKLCIVDDEVAFCGGLDVNTGRVDTTAHNARRTAWHDVHLQVDGKAAVDIHRNFVSRWNEESSGFTAFVVRANAAGMPSPKLPQQEAVARMTYSEKQPGSSGRAKVQIIRTLSKDAFLGVVPNNEVDDIVRSYRAAIENAQHYIYIENQYVREPRLREWISKRAKVVKDLVVLIVLPVAPEEVARTIDPITNQGLLRQREVLEGLAGSLESRLGVFSMVKRVLSGTVHATDSFRSPQIYVHSKLMLVDDVWATIGSANANPRSFYVDTELNAAVYDPAVVSRLRLSLWNELLGSPRGLETWKPSEFVDQWARHARANAAAQPRKRQGFVVPHDPSKFPGAGTIGLPDEFVDRFDAASALAGELPA